MIFPRGASRAAEKAADRAAGRAAQADEHAERAEQAATRAEDAASDAAETVEAVESAVADAADETGPADEGHLGEPGATIVHSPFYIGFTGAIGALLAFWLGQQLLAVSGILMLIVVSMFLAAGLDPVVDWLMRRGMRRGFAVLAVIAGVLAAFTLFGFAIVPVISDQVAALTQNAPEWLDMLQENDQVQQWNEQYQIIDKAKSYIADANFGERLFGGVLGFGLAVVSALLNAFVVVVLTLYFMASLPKTKQALYQLAPSSRRDRVSRLGDQIMRGIGGYVSGAFVVAMAAGLSSLVFLMVVGLSEYAVALSFVVGLFSLIPLVGATISMVLVSAIGFTVSVPTGIACLVFYAAYQQVENYVIYPRVMSRSVDVPGSVTVVAALVGAGLLGVVGALLAVPTAAAILLLTREVFIRRQDAR